MTRDDIIRMAMEIGGIDEPEPDSPSVAFLERFVALVQKAEREACAKVCEQMETYGDPVQCWLDQCAAAIRARGET